jgi:hypothetical protein
MRCEWKLEIHCSLSLVLLNDRNAAMAAASGGADPQRARSGRAVSPHIPRHHGPQAAHRLGRQQGR